jgi:hypothetical protein
MRDRRADNSIEEFVRWLGSQGFLVTEDVYSERDFGNWSREFSGHGIGVRVVRDRGQWFVEARGPGSKWFSIQAWSQCLDDDSGISASVQEQMAFVSRSLGKMQTAATSGGSVESCLEREQRKLIAAEIDLPPGLDPNQPSVLRPPVDAGAMQREAAARLARRRVKRRT